MLTMENLGAYHWLWYLINVLLHDDRGSEWCPANTDYTAFADIQIVVLVEDKEYLR